MENNLAHSISMSQTSPQVDAHAVNGTISGDQDGNLRPAPEQVDQESQTGVEAQKETLEAEMKYQHNRRHFLRQVQKDIGQTINFYGVVLVLSIAVTFMGFLQPPGGVDGNGQMRQHTHMNRYIIFVYSSFFLASSGIFVCMSCVAFVLPRNTKYGRPTLAGGMSSKGPAVGSNSVYQQMLDIEVKTNNKIARTLKLAHIHGIVANLFFVLSFTFSVYAFIVSSWIVMSSEQKQTFERAILMTIIGWIVTVLAPLYMAVLLWQIIKAVMDLFVDSIELIKRLPSQLGSSVRFSPSSSLLERWRNSVTDL